MGIYHRVWATPLFEVHNPNHGQIKSGLITYFRQRERDSETDVESGVAKNAKRDLFESKFDLFQADILEVRMLMEFCRNSISEALEMLKDDTGPGMPEFEIHESWIHITRDRGYHDYHGHPGCFWCGIYYVDPGDCAFEGRNGCNRFYNPVPAYFRGDTGRRYDYVDMEPEEGKLILFPSFIAHSALPYRGQRDRIVIAFNSRLANDPN